MPTNLKFANDDKVWIMHVLPHEKGKSVFKFKETVKAFESNDPDGTK